MSNIKRLFIETDILHKDELRRAERNVSWILDEKGLKYPKDVFDEIRDFAWHKMEEAWEAVKRCDEIYGDSSLVPLSGYGTYTGAPVIMDKMMKMAIAEKIEGKSLIFLRPFKDIEWTQIDLKLLPKAFKKNKLFTLEYDNGHQLVQVDCKNIRKLIKAL